jgi:Holliday junction DNA helicase RuvA
VITHIRGLLRAVGEDEIIVGLEAIDLEVLIPENARRALQGKLGELISLATIFYVEGNTMGGRMNPRLVGFLTPIDREFFEIFCSVDGVGVRKALGSMVRPVRELARMIQDQDVKMLATLPGIGEATAERIVAKLRRKVGKFALIVSSREAAETAPVHEANGAAETATDDVIRDTYAALLSVGHTDSQARELIDRACASKKKFKSVPDMIEAIYHQQRPDR